MARTRCDCVEAERPYHCLFREKRINGEWFDLQDNVKEQIRGRVVA